MRIADTNSFLAHVGTLNRRQLLQGAAGAAAAMALPRTAQAAPAFKPVWLSHYTYVAPDMKKTADWYHEVFAMQIGQTSAKQTDLWYGDKGGDTRMIVRQANAGEAAPRIERFAFALESWNRGAVEAELKRRGLQFQADGDKGFWFKDPEGNDIGVFAKDSVKRPAARAEKPFLWKAVSANHVVVLSPDYKKLGAWYQDLLALRVTSDAGRDVYQWFGDTVWIPTATRQGEKSSGELRTLDHVAYTIDPFDSDPVVAELKRRKMIPEDANVKGSLGPNCVDINGFKTQICARQLVPDAEKNRAKG